ncbi:nitroreductase family protein [Anaerosacchariphilus polymeriproducens]|uniref:Nitroreductase family protein n=1 Tax=Anaerosacchariphilus polymeriproducens TaxID=1812858 RepID=A0A371AQR4_9FIRM|nr:nitroreductase family protein [Anaerosacchariphilus polymeriproducens]RDU21908.1 nitroreductase family protein [Anaerosacchariphilus polymeriproducens]
MNNIFNRVSVREYQNKKVEDEKIVSLLKAAMASPSAANQQPWEFFVVKNKAVLEQLATASPYAGCTKEAAFAIVPCYRNEGLLFGEFAHIDMSACCENILLEAVEQGLGGVWIGIAPVKERMDAVADVLKLPDNLTAFAIIPCGYPMKEEKQQNRFEESRIHYVN